MSFVLSVCTLGARNHQVVSRMSRMILVRHGQARFLTADYDRLSELGEEQARLLGRFWRDNGVSLSHVYAGSLKRQQHTAALVCQEFAGQRAPTLQTQPGLNEYPFDEVMQAAVPALAKDFPDIAVLRRAFSDADSSDDRYRAIQRLLERVTQILADEQAHDHYAPELPSWSSFVTNVGATLDAIRNDAPAGATVGVFTSGGVVAVAIQQALSAQPDAAARLCWRVVNASVSELTFSGQRLSLDSFNKTEHMPAEIRTYR